MVTFILFGMWHSALAMGSAQKNTHLVTIRLLLFSVSLFLPAFLIHCIFFFVLPLTFVHCLNVLLPMNMFMPIALFQTIRPLLIQPRTCDAQHIHVLFATHVRQHDTDGRRVVLVRPVGVGRDGLSAPSVISWNWAPLQCESTIDRSRRNTSPTARTSTTTATAATWRLCQRGTHAPKSSASSLHTSTFKFFKFTDRSTTA